MRFLLCHPERSRGICSKHAYMSQDVKLGHFIKLYYLDRTVYINLINFQLILSAPGHSGPRIGPGRAGEEIALLTPRTPGLADCPHPVPHLVVSLRGCIQTSERFDTSHKTHAAPSNSIPGQTQSFHHHCKQKPTQKPTSPDSPDRMNRIIPRSRQEKNVGICIRYRTASIHP